MCQCHLPNAKDETVTNNAFQDVFVFLLMRGLSCTAFNFVALFDALVH